MPRLAMLEPVTNLVGIEPTNQSNARNRVAGLLASRHDLALEFGSMKPACSLRWNVLHSVHLSSWWTPSSVLKRVFSR